MVQARGFYKGKGVGPMPPRGKGGSSDAGKNMARVKAPRGSPLRQEEISQLKKVTQRIVCGQMGHWQGNQACRGPPPGAPIATVPSSLGAKGTGGFKGRSAHETARVTFSEEAEVVDPSMQGDPQAYGAWVAERVSPSPHHVWIAQAPVNDSRGCAVLDTACEKTVTGSAWLESYESLVQEFGLYTIHCSENETFRVGAGGNHISTLRVRFPAVISGSPVEIRAGLTTPA